MCCSAYSVRMSLPTITKSPVWTPVLTIVTQQQPHQAPSIAHPLLTTMVANALDPHHAVQHAMAQSLACLLGNHDLLGSLDHDGRVALALLQAAWTGQQDDVGLHVRPCLQAQQVVDDVLRAIREGGCW